MDTFLESLGLVLENLWARVPTVLLAAVVFGLFLAAGFGVRGLLLRLLARGALSETHHGFFRTLIVVLFGLFGAITALDILGLERVATGLVAGGGVTAIALGFAFKEIGENFLAGFFLAFSRPFEVGDLIRSGEFEGEVRNVEMRCTHIRTADATDVYLPNSQLFSQPLVNYTRDGLRRPTVTLGIDYGDDPGRALESVLAATRGTPGVLEQHAPRATVAELGAQYVVLQVSFWVDTFDKSRPLLAVQSDVLSNCHGALKEAGFTFSSDVTTSVALSSRDSWDVRLESRGTS